MLSLDGLHTFLGCFMEAEVLLNFVRHPTRHCSRLMVRLLFRGASWKRSSRLNDPTGFKARAGVQAKAAVGIKAFEIPKRSPDLNVCDYALWAAVNRKMRRQEKKIPRAKRETPAEHIARLRRAAHSLTPAFINKSIGDLRRRCQRLV